MSCPDTSRRVYLRVQLRIALKSGHSSHPNISLPVPFLKQAFPNSKSALRILLEETL